MTKSNIIIYKWSTHHVEVYGKEENAFLEEGTTTGRRRTKHYNQNAKYNYNPNLNNQQLTTNN